MHGHQVEICPCMVKAPILSESLGHVVENVHLGADRELLCSSGMTLWDAVFLDIHKNKRTYKTQRMSLHLLCSMLPHDQAGDGPPVLQRPTAR